MQQLNSSEGNLYLRITAVVSAEKPGVVVHSIEELAKYPRCLLETLILSALQHSIGFNFSLTTTKSYGELNSKTHRWNGMTGLLINNTADLEVTGYPMLPSHSSLVDYSLPLGFVPGSFTFFRRSSLLYDSWALTRPFHLNLWLVITMLMVISSILVALIIISKNCTKNSRRCANISAIYSGMLWSIETISLKNQYSLTMSKASRILFLTFSPAAYIINAAYNGMLLSYLTIPLEPFNRLDQLMAVPFKFVLDNNVQFLAEDLEMRQNTKGFKAAVIELPETFRGLNSVKMEVLKGSFAFVCNYYGYKDLKDKFSPSEQASIAEIPVLTERRVNYALMLRKGSPYNRLINRQLTKSIESGLTKLWMTRVRVRRLDSTQSTFLPQQPIFIVSIVVAAVIFVGGVVIAATIFLLEIWHVRNRMIW